MKTKKSDVPKVKSPKNSIAWYKKFDSFIWDVFFKDGLLRPSRAEHIPLVAELYHRISRKLPPREARAALAHVPLLMATHENYRKDYAKRFMDYYGQPLNRVIRGAKGGDSQQFFTLVEWDKKFLFEDWAKRRILANQYKQDRDFFKRLSKRIGLMKGYSKRGTQNRDLRYIVREFRYRGWLDPDDPKSVNATRKKLGNETWAQSFTDQEIGTLAVDSSFRQFVRKLFSSNSKLSK